MLAHLTTYPRDAVLLSVAMPTIAFAGVTEVPAEAWAIVESAAPSYGDDPWFLGLLAFVRQEQRRYDDAMNLSCTALAADPTAGHAAHARAHAHYETGDHHRAGWPGWTPGCPARGRSTESLTHFSWHAALHELSLGDLDAVRKRYTEQLQPRHAVGCRALVDTGSMLYRWALTPDAEDVPDLEEVARVTGRGAARGAGDRRSSACMPRSTLLALGDLDGLRRLATRCASHPHAAQREVVAPLADALWVLGSGRASEAADRLACARPAVLAVRRLRCAARDHRGDPDRGPAPRGEVRRRAGAARQPARPPSLTRATIRWRQVAAAAR